jgi:hypothetical protein
VRQHASDDLLRIFREICELTTALFFEIHIPGTFSMPSENQFTHFPDIPRLRIRPTFLSEPGQCQIETENLIGAVGADGTGTLIPSILPNPQRNS